MVDESALEETRAARPGPDGLDELEDMTPAGAVSARRARNEDATSSRGRRRLHPGGDDASALPLGGDFRWTNEEDGDDES